MRTMNLVTGLAMLMLSFNAFSKCEVTYDRTACPGQEKASYAKCDGQKVCTKTESAEDLGECQDAGVKACANSRLLETKSKVVTVKWAGKDIMSKSGKKDFCEDYAKKDAEFNHCK